MSGLVERLRQTGLLIGCRGEPDRRRQYWRLTVAGSELLQRICAGLEEWPPGTDASFPQQDQGALWELVQKLAHDLAGAGHRADSARPHTAPVNSQEADDETSHRRAS
jgi:DNA-binding MarR family transcriptional regulator